MLQEDTGKEIPYAITEDEAQKAAYEALKKQSEEGYVNSIENLRREEKKKNELAIVCERSKKALSRLMEIKSRMTL